jgi:hypothetical protein
MVYGCKEQTAIDYKYSEKEELFPCSESEMDLIKEAIYAFEEYAINHYAKYTPKTIGQGMYFYWRVSINEETYPKLQVVPPHIIKLRDLLKQEKELWIITDEKVHLNYNHPILTCIGNAMSEKNKKEIFNTLLNSNTFKSNVYLQALKRKELELENDTAFRTYLALDTFYAKIMNVDFNDLDTLYQKLREERLKPIQLDMERQLKNAKPIDSIHE